MELQKYCDQRSGCGEGRSRGGDKGCGLGGRVPVEMKEEGRGDGVDTCNR